MRFKFLQICFASLWFRAAGWWCLLNNVVPCSLHIPETRLESLSCIQSLQSVNHLVCLNWWLLDTQLTENKTTWHSCIKKYCMLQHLDYLQIDFKVLFLNTESEVWTPFFKQIRFEIFRGEDKEEVDAAAFCKMFSKPLYRLNTLSGNSNFILFKTLFYIHGALL